MKTLYTSVKGLHHPIPVEMQIRGYMDEHITWLMQVYMDAPLAVKTLERLRRFYPDSRIILVSDGDPDPVWKEVAERFRCTLHSQERLVLYEKGAATWIKRLAYFFEAPTKFLLKIDPDTGIHRRFFYLPDVLAFSTIFGSTDGINPGSCNGGFIGLTRECCEILRDEKGFEKVHEHGFWPAWANSHSKLEGRTHISEDQILASALSTLRIPLRMFSEVLTTVGVQPWNRDNFYAITHPCKQGVD